MDKEERRQELINTAIERILDKYNLNADDFLETEELEELAKLDFELGYSDYNPDEEDEE